jgi:hypothetical protein
MTQPATNNADIYKIHLKSVEYSSLEPFKIVLANDHEYRCMHGYYVL